jgi:hypothetical protein
MMEVRESIFSGQTNFFCPVQDSNVKPLKYGRADVGASIIWNVDHHRTVPKYKV